MNQIASTVMRVLSLLVCSMLAGCSGPTDFGDSSTTTASTPGDARNRLGSDDDASELPSSDAEQGNDPNQAQTSGASGGAATEPTVASSRPTPSRAGSSDEVHDISFDDIQLPIQQDTVFRPFMLTDRVKDLDGKRIRINGYMLPDTKTKGIKQFVLLKNTECKFGPGGQADHLLNVIMVEGEDARFRSDPVSVEGRLIIKPFRGPDGNTWSIYDLACERVTRYRPRR